MFDDEDEVSIDQMDQLLYELDDESIDESYQDSDESESNESITHVPYYIISY
jgi:hypothetical protein